MFTRIAGLLNLWRTGRLVWRLMGDRRVPLSAKLVLPAGLLYALFPLDLLPDFLLALGQLDDLTVLLISMALFLHLCPPHVVMEHLEDLAGRKPQPDREPDPKKVIDGDYRILE